MKSRELRMTRALTIFTEREFTKKCLRPALDAAKNMALERRESRELVRNREVSTADLRGVRSDIVSSLRSTSLLG